MINALEATVPQVELCPCINVSFSLAGKQLPADHGYLLYSAISKATQRGSSPTPGSPAEHLGWGGAVREGFAGSAGILPAPSTLH